jgi:hypothetical protein
VTRARWLRALLWSGLFIEGPQVTAQVPQLTARIRVPATANPYLSGMPPGTKARLTDKAPEQSPVLANLPPNSLSVSFEAAGKVEHAPFSPPQYDPPDGSAPTRHDGGAENGISAVIAPMNSLVGVFLTDEQPDRTPAPKELKLKNNGRDLPAVSPQLKQIFFIGTGKTRTGVKRSYLVPKGATRLFLGVMDGWDWNNNDGEFRVVITLERTDVSSNMFSVDSRLAFADWACLPDRTHCTPDAPVVRDLGQGRFHIVLPAHLEWSASIPTPAGVKVEILGATGTVCLDGKAPGVSTCNGPGGNGTQVSTGVLVKTEPVGALVKKTETGRTFFSVNGHTGPAFQKQEGFFEFDVTTTK